MAKPTPACYHRHSQSAGEAVGRMGLEDPLLRQRVAPMRTGMVGAVLEMIENCVVGAVESWSRRDFAAN